MEVALYVRVSTNRQQQQQTIEQQLARLREHIMMQPDWHLADDHVYRDDGYSGAKLNRPGLDRLRDRAALGAFERVLLTAPDRLARNYVHQMVLLEELTQHGCQVEFLDRPMSDDPHDQLLLQIRGAVAEYERTLIADRMRRGRQAKIRSGLLLPWTVPPYGYLLDPECPRDPSRLRLDPVKAAVVTHIFAWYTEPQMSSTLYGVAKRLSDAQLPTPMGKPRWNASSVRGILCNPVYTGIAHSGKSHPVPARLRQSALRPVGPGVSHRPTPPEDWVPIPVPAMISPDMFDAAQARLERNSRTARRNNTTYTYLLRGLVSCGQCQLACTGRTSQSGYSYYWCRGRTDPLRAALGERCIARYIRAQALDALVWEDLSQVLTQPALITHELQRAQGGAWLPQALQARQCTLREVLAQIERQHVRLLDVYLAEVIGREEFERKRHELTQTQQSVSQQLRQIEAQAHQQVDVLALAHGIDAFCHRLGPTLDHLTFTQRRQLVALLIDRVIVNDGQVEIRYVMPTGPKGETVPFCHLRLDYFNGPSAAGHLHHRLQHGRLGGKHDVRRELCRVAQTPAHQEPPTPVGLQRRGQGEPLPVIKARAFGAVTSTQPAPALCPQCRQDAFDLVLPIGTPDIFFSRDGQNIGVAVFLQPPPQRPIIPIDTITRHPGSWDARVEGALQHLLRQLRLGREGTLHRNPRALTARCVVGPLFGEIEFPIE